jgi:ribosome-associated protein
MAQAPFGHSAWPEDSNRGDRVLDPVLSPKNVVGWGQRRVLTSSELRDTATALQGPLTTELPSWLVAARAAESKKAKDLLVLDLREVTSFTDYFVICTSANPRQGQAIADEIGKQLKELGELPISAEGYDSAEWILLDYGDFLVHILSGAARSYYDLERLWRHAMTVNLKSPR